MGRILLRALIAHPEMGIRSILASAFSLHDEVETPDVRDAIKLTGPYDVLITADPETPQQLEIVGIRNHFGAASRPGDIKPTTSRRALWPQTEYLGEFAQATLDAFTHSLLKEAWTAALEAEEHVYPYVRKGPLIINVELRKTYLNGAPVDLTAGEFNVLATLLIHKGVISHNQILSLNYNEGTEPETKVVEAQIARIRKKFELAGGTGAEIETVNGLGWVIRDPDEIYAERLIHIGKFSFNPEADLAFYGDEQLLLTAYEHKALFLMMRHVDSPVSRKQFEEALYGDELPADSNVIQALMLRLRKKILAAGAEGWEIETIRGKGYRLNSKSPEERAKLETTAGADVDEDPDDNARAEALAEARRDAARMFLLLEAMG